MDLADPAAPAALCAAIAARGLTVDVLVNNAGYGVPGRYVSTSWQQQADFLQVLVTAVAELTHRLLPGMVERRWGRVMNVASLAALVPAAPGPYALRRVEGLSRQVLGGAGARGGAARRPRHRVCPGFTYTEFHDVTGTRAQVSTMPRWAWQDAREVVAVGYDAVMAGRSVVVQGSQPYFAFGARHLPGARPAPRYGAAPAGSARCDSSPGRRPMSGPSYIALQPPLQSCCPPLAGAGAVAACRDPAAAARQHHRPAAHRSAGSAITRRTSSPGSISSRCREQFNRALLTLLSTSPVASPSGGFTYTFDSASGTFRVYQRELRPDLRRTRAHDRPRPGQRRLRLSALLRRHLRGAQPERPRAATFYVPHTDCCSRAGGPVAEGRRFAAHPRRSRATRARESWRSASPPTRRSSR